MQIPSVPQPAAASPDALKIRRRARSWLREPRLQLTLIAWLLGLAALFTAGWAIQTYFAFETFAAAALNNHLEAASLRALLIAQWHDFALATGVIALAYALALSWAVVAHDHRMLGPVVALRRQLQALLHGDYAARVTIRKRDALGELARDLNELAAALEEDAKRHRA